MCQIALFISKNSVNPIDGHESVSGACETLTIKMLLREIYVGQNAVFLLLLVAGYISQMLCSQMSENIHRTLYSSIMIIFLPKKAFEDILKMSGFVSLPLYASMILPCRKFKQQY